MAQPGGLGLTDVSQDVLRVRDGFAAQLLAVRPGYSAFPSRLETITRIHAPSPVVGVGIGASADGEPVVDILIREDISSPTGRLSEQFPKRFGGVLVRVTVVGNLLPLTAGSLTKHRPVTPGTSIAPIGINGAGTLGAIATDGESYFALSNNHVLALADSLPIGTDIIQPARPDGGTADDVIGQLAKTVPLTAGVPDVDCALAKLTVEHAASVGAIGVVTTAVAPRTGMKVRKIGRTSGLTEGTILSLGVTFGVSYRTPNGVRPVVLTDQFLTDPAGGLFADEGDSGSMIVDERGYAVGLVVAGSPLAASGCEMERVLAQLGVRLA